MNESLNIPEAISNLRTSISGADSEFDKEIIYGEEWASAAWSIQKCFLQLLAITEAAGLTEFYKVILADYAALKDTEKGFLKASTTPDGEPYSMVLSQIRQYQAAIQQFYITKEPTRVTKDLLQILRDIHYTIADKKLFGSVPKNENDVHLRIEGILRCLFPDLKHKPTLTKAIKNFEPDTGIPSIETIIEYKFLSSQGDVKVIADQILADTRGYTSKDWNHFIYILYETNRFRPEKEWVQFLRDSGVSGNTNVIVLSGEPTKKKPVINTKKQ